MLTRRHVCCGLPAAAAAPALVQSSDAAAREPVAADATASLTPADVLAELKAGNQRFVDGDVRKCDPMNRIIATSEGQNPTASVIGCIDSRVPHEQVFDQRIGEIFSARVAGNFVNVDMTGSLEFATAVAGAKLIVVLGHNNCGAVKGAIDGVQLGNLTATLTNIMPAVAELDPDFSGSSTDDVLVQDVAVANVKLNVAKLLRDSEVIRGLVESGDVMVVGAMYDISTGVVTFM
ncbi:MAG: carbonic anhydrase family protein [Pseudomonadota bacterium]